MSTPSDSDLAALVAAVAQSTKYRSIDPALVQRLGAHELRIRPNLKAAVKATKNRLHQIAGAYLDKPPPYSQLHAQIATAAQTGDQTQLRVACAQAMERHASTRERLPLLDDFYGRIFAALPRVTHVLDLACGFNPLALPWMPLAETTYYDACDIYSDLSAFLNGAFEAMNVRGSATTCELITQPPQQRADVALVLKTLPVLEQVQRGASHDMLRALRVRYMVVSFPTRSLGGRNRQMAAHYGVQFRAFADGERWHYEELLFANELVFVVEKPRPSDR